MWAQVTRIEQATFLTEEDKNKLDLVRSGKNCGVIPFKTTTATILEK